MLIDRHLRALLELRAAPGGDRGAIDRQIVERYGETWCMMATDLSGFSRGVAERGIIHYLQILHQSELLLGPTIDRHRGTLLKIEGDSFFAIFAEPRDALDAALEMQTAARAHNAHVPAGEQVLLGVGLGYGPVLRLGAAEVFGAEVNAACILGETFAGPYDILVTRAVRDAIEAGVFEEFPHVPPGAGGAYRVVYELPGGR